LPFTCWGLSFLGFGRFVYFLVGVLDAPILTILRQPGPDCEGYYYAKIAPEVGALGALGASEKFYTRDKFPALPGTGLVVHWLSE